MVSVSGSKKLKRQMAPLFWGITRKDKRFVTTVRPGPHSKEYSIPLAVFLRDTIKMVSTQREAKAQIYGGAVTVDGVQRKSLHHGIGLMDVVELKNVKDVFRLVPKDGAFLVPIKIANEEKSKKLCQVKSKTTIRGGKMQIGFHDGRSLLSDQSVNVGDTCMIQIPEQKILDVIKLEKGCKVIVTRGLNAGQLGTVEEIKEGSFVLPRMATVKFEGREIEIPTDITMAVGKDKPVIQIE